MILVAVAANPDEALSDRRRRRARSWATRIPAPGPPHAWMKLPAASNSRTGGAARPFSSGLKRARALQHPHVILRIDRHAGDLSELPVVRDLRPRRIDLEPRRLGTGVTCAATTTATIKKAAADAMSRLMATHSTARETRRDLWHNESSWSAPAAARRCRRRRSTLISDDRWPSTSVMPASHSGSTRARASRSRRGRHCRCSASSVRS